ncbi:MAG: DUF177 domain-containing protein [Desulfuromonadales bacterium]|nr:DUF177 domain-containing protein [Desulfuromonadales bacterium]
MLTIQIDSIKEHELHLNGEIITPELAGLVSTDQLNLSGPVSYDFKLSRIGEMITVRGQVAAQLRLACGRCLELFDLPVSADFDLTYAKQLPEVEVGFDDEIELTADDLGIVLLTGEEIDLFVPLVEQLLLCLPLQAFCREECKGLCLHCGTDLNYSACNCNAPQFDTRFSVLENLKIDSGKSYRK